MNKGILLLAVVLLVGCRDQDSFKTSEYSKPVLDVTNSAAGANRNPRIDTDQPRPPSEQPVQSASGASNEAAPANQPK